RPLEQEIIGLGAVAAADAVDVARALGHHQRRARAVALDGGVDRDRRAVNEGVGRVDRQMALGQGLADADREIVRRGRGFRVMDRAGGKIEGDEIGEGAADIESNDKRHAKSLAGRAGPHAYSGIEAVAKGKCLRAGPLTSPVTLALVARVHAFRRSNDRQLKAWMLGTSPSMSPCRYLGWRPAAQSPAAARREPERLCSSSRRTSRIGTG